MNPSDLRVGVGESKSSSAGTGQLVTHALGSCLAVTFYDPESRAGAMLHAMLPGPPQPGETANKPDIYLTSGLPRLQKAYEAAGGKMARVVVCAAGAAELINDKAGFKIGARNWAAMRKLCFKQGIRIVAQEVGGNVTRNLSLDLATGEVSVTSGGTKKTIWSGAVMPRREAS